MSTPISTQFNPLLEPSCAIACSGDKEMVLSMGIALFSDHHGLVHECEGMNESEGQAMAWTLCEGKAARNLHAGDPMDVTCRQCRELRVAAWIQHRPVIGWGPPELHSSSWPKSLQVDSG
jgi:hypothetical protein